MSKLIKIVWLLLVMSVIGVVAMSQARLNQATKFMSNVDTYQRYVWYRQGSDRLDVQRDSVGYFHLQHIEWYEMYNEHPASHWSAYQRDQFQRSYTLWRTSAISFNELAKKYNSRMQDERYPFTDTKSLPPDIGKPLPREYKQFMIPDGEFQVYVY